MTSVYCVWTISLLAGPQHGKKNKRVVHWASNLPLTKIVATKNKVSQQQQNQHLGVELREEMKEVGKTWTISWLAKKTQDAWRRFNDMICCFYYSDPQSVPRRVAANERLKTFSPGLTNVK